MVDEWKESDEYEIGEWLWRKCGMSTHNADGDSQYFLGFELVTTDVGSLGIFDCECNKKKDDMSKAFESFESSINPKLYLVSCYA